VCNAQNNLIDDAWFGRANVFNVADEKSHTWQATTEPIVFPEGKTWQDYVSDNRLEVACGEAPYLVSPYDTTTGIAIPLSQRIGLLDRKLRVVNENADPIEWIKWAMVAVKSTYGFEWQGDNILLAREAILFSFIEYYNDFCKNVVQKDQKLSLSTIRAVAYIISWNIFQMDGITLTLPLSGTKPQNKIVDLFDATSTTLDISSNDIEKEKIYALVSEWKKEGEKNQTVCEFRRLCNLLSK
jgi:hypothetical protein